MKLSFIIPCFRAEKYIATCLDSIFANGLSENDFEVICFDDCSPDNTPSYLDQYASKHKNVVIIHSKENVGPGGGRNRALAIAQGKYIWFVDIDDRIIPNSVIGILSLLETNDLEVLVVDYSEINEDGSVAKNNNGMVDSNILNGRQLGNSVFKGGLLYNMGYPWRFVSSKRYLLNNNIMFPERMVYGEDTVWMAKIVLLSNRIMSTSICAYAYCYHDNSTCGQMNRTYPGKTIFEKCIIVPEQIMQFAEELKLSNDIESHKYADDLSKFAKTYYLNTLPIMLGRMKRKERQIFYKLLSLNKHEIINQSNTITKLMTLPCIGSLLADLFSTSYKLTHNHTR